MGAAAGPKVVKDGLVFEYDQANTEKSWKGAPTTNLGASHTIKNHSLGVSPTFENAPERGIGWKKATITDTSSNFRMLKMDSFSFPANATLTYSIEFECSNSDVYLNIDGTGFGGGPWTKIGNTRYSRTVTNATAGTAYLFFCSANLNAVVDYVIYYKEYQIEDAAFASPFVNGTRSNTEAIEDLTGNNNITASSLTYNADGSFDFSVQSYLSSAYNPALDLTDTVTLDAWVKYTTTANTVCIEKSNNNTHYQFQIFSSGYGSGLGGELAFMLQSNAANWVVAGEANNDGLWHYIVGTYDRSLTTAKIYVDGILKNTNASITTGPYTNTQPLMIGSRSGNAGFGGSINAVRVYNKVLTAAEVKQNFEATRSRYGI